MTSQSTSFPSCMATSRISSKRFNSNRHHRNITGPWTPKFTSAVSYIPCALSLKCFTVDFLHSWGIHDVSGQRWGYWTRPLPLICLSEDDVTPLFVWSFFIEKKTYCRNWISKKLNYWFFSSPTILCVFYWESHHELWSNAKGGEDLLSWMRWKYASQDFC